jgi:ribonuclease BN (tRNA processing enzyme)
MATAHDTTPLEHPPPLCERTPAALCVLASSSGGNCSLLAYSDRGQRRLALIDAGLSPRRTARELARLGCRLADVADICFTHLDTDHCHPGWRRRPRDCRAVFRVHKRHMRRAERTGLCNTGDTQPFDDGFDLAPAARVRAEVMAHDDLGVAAFRFDLAADARRPASLGFATDLGRARPPLIEALAGVEVLAIESNYCPEMQRSSGRPLYLQRRIMDGSGHLSNQEAHDATAAIAPRDHAVFLHLSRECNRPELVAAMHEGADYARTIAAPDAPTRWIPIHATEATPRKPHAPTRVVQPGLFTGGGASP